MRRTGKLLWRGYWKAISNARLAKKLSGCRWCPPSQCIYGRSILADPYGYGYGYRGYGGWGYNPYYGYGYYGGSPYFRGGILPSLVLVKDQPFSGYLPVKEPAWQSPLIACIEIAAPCRIMSGGLTVLYLPIAPAGLRADRDCPFT